MAKVTFSKEMKAYEGLQDLFRRAQEVKAWFDDAGIPAPPPLARMLGIQPENGAAVSTKPRLFVSPPDAPPRPDIATDDWMWLQATDATPTSLLLSVLRKHEEFVPSKQVIEAVNAIKPFNSGSLFNIASRLDGSIVERSDAGWRLKDREAAPVLFEGNLWGEPRVFGKYELAAHRRYLILHLLSAAPGGLQIMQIVDQLSGDREMCHAPVTKDLVKADMDVLQEEGKARRVGNSKKWTRAEAKQ